MNTIFILASGRSGTMYLSELFRNNFKNCVCKHEPYPNMFGKPIYWFYKGDFEKIEKNFKLKKFRIDTCKKDYYIETNHAFLKSFSEVSIKYFPDMKLIHLIRNPLKVAKSELNRQEWLDKKHFPFRYYKIKRNNRFFRWALTGKEPIFQDVKIEKITPYQWYLLQWIEIENRAIRFLKKYNKEKDCFTLFVPQDINDPEAVDKMFDFLDIKKTYEKIRFEGKKNKNPVKTVVEIAEEKQFEEIINNIPKSYLDIFKEKPYTRFNWIKT